MGLPILYPVSDRENQSINDFGKWEQAFRVYANVYTKMFPEKASELIQYNHVIYTASLSYLWDNVYTYDKEFRMHISQFPQRSWAVILQQAWTLYMKDRLRYAGGGNVQNTERNGNRKKRKFAEDSIKASVKTEVVAGMIIAVKAEVNGDMVFTFVETDN